MVGKLAQERRVELTAIFILALWVIAWIVSLNLGAEIPQALNVVMPVASATLLGVRLPVGERDKKGSKE